MSNILLSPLTTRNQVLNLSRKMLAFSIGLSPCSFTYRIQKQEQVNLDFSGLGNVKDGKEQGCRMWWEEKKKRRQVNSPLFKNFHVVCRALHHRKNIISLSNTVLLISESTSLKSLVPDSFFNGTYLLALLNNW